MSLVRLTTLAPTRIAAVRRRTTFPEVPRTLLAGLDVVWSAVRSRPLDGPGRNVAIYHKLGGDDVDLVCGVEIAERFDDIGEVACAWTPSGEAGHATHVGPYHRLGETYDAVAAFVLQAGRRLAPVNWEIYGHWNEDPTKLETEVHMLLKLD